MCGPLLNYKRMSKNSSGTSTWHGSVLIVAESGGQVYPELTLKCNGPVAATSADAVNGAANALPRARPVQGVKLFDDSAKSFWRFSLEVPFQKSEMTWEYSISPVQLASGGDSAPRRTFVVPASDQSMRIMFHSCNGFSVGTDEDAWSGPALWNDVLRVHSQKPFHVMIGGGDQIYNDGVRVGGPLNTWTAIGNPKKRRDFPFPEDLRDDCDEYYFNNYAKWFSSQPFAGANSRIPQVNIWDDHGMSQTSGYPALIFNLHVDIIDGFGSYTDHFMRCAVFRGIGGVSLKYYCLFQHHIPPPISTCATSAPQTMGNQGAEGAGADPVQPKDTFVLYSDEEDPSFIMGAKPGPYVQERSRSLYTQLGARIALLGVDARTERTRHRVNYSETYDLLFERVHSELSANPGLAHLIVLLGVPIAYPRLAWLESIFTSPIIGPIRFLSKRFGVAGGLFNKFDGQVDLLDDLDDHYTSRHHKHERKALILRLQELAKQNNVRVSILGGDVHLAALGRFYSNPKLNIPITKDFRYMANIISSAITNKPPPKAIANLLARRNFIHHLDHDTDETLMNMFDKDPGATSITSNTNHCTMPSRNYAIITEHQPSEPRAADSTHLPSESADIKGGIISLGHKAGHSAIHAGEEGAGTKHVAASGVDRGTLEGGLDVAIRVEINQHDKEGHTEGYGFSIPPLNA